MLDPLPENSTTRFGQALVTLGDINGDGVPDLAVAAPFQDGDFVSTQTSYGKPQNVGKIFLLDGSNLSILNELNDPEFEQIQLQHFGGQLGTSMASVADLNGDGIADLIAGVPHHIADPKSDEQIINAGEAFVFSGNDGVLLFTLTDPTVEENGKMGAAVAGLGDVDADGTPDVAVGAPGKDIGGEDGIANVGLVYSSAERPATHSDPEPSLTRAVQKPAPPLAQPSPMRAMWTATRCSDILAGAPGEGHVFVFSGRTGNLIFDIASPLTEDLHSFGAAVAGGKDFNRDRKPDLVVGAPNYGTDCAARPTFSTAATAACSALCCRKRQPFAKFGASLCVSE